MSLDTAARPPGYCPATSQATQRYNIAVGGTTRAGLDGSQDADVGEIGQRELLTPEPYVLATNLSAPERLLEMAISKDLDVDKLERLMVMQKEWVAEQSRLSYYSALSKFQAACPILKKNKTVKFKTNGGGEIEYSYAELSSIADQIKVAVKDNGFSYRWEIQDDNIINVTCLVSHEKGHVEITKMSGLPDASGKKNAIQQRASTVSYLQRYTLIGALGLTSADDDVDAAGYDDRLLTMIASVRENYDSICAIKESLALGEMSTAAEEWFQLDKQTKTLLWVAPTKGGIFTTEEREFIRSDGFSKLYYGDKHEHS